MPAITPATPLLRGRGVHTLVLSRALAATAALVAVVLALAGCSSAGDATTTVAPPSTGAVTTTAPSTATTGGATTTNVDAGGPAPALEKVTGTAVFSAGYGDGPGQFGYEAGQEAVTIGPRALWVAPDGTLSILDPKHDAGTGGRPGRHGDAHGDPAGQGSARPRSRPRRHAARRRHRRHRRVEGLWRRRRPRGQRAEHVGRHIIVPPGGRRHDRLRRGGDAHRRHAGVRARVRGRRPADPVRGLRCRRARAPPARRVAGDRDVDQRTAHPEDHRDRPARASRSSHRWNPPRTRM